MMKISNADEIIAKLNKEKRHIAENTSKASEDLQVSQDKVDHLAKIKTKLESTLDELNDLVTREKKSRADVEKQRMKVEGDLGITQEVVAELKRNNHEIGNAILRKDKDITGHSAKHDDEQSVVAKLQKSVKEHQGRVEELEEELETERHARAKAERQRPDLARAWSLG